MLEPVLHRCDSFGFDGFAAYSLAEEVNKYCGALKTELQQEFTERRSLLFESEAQEWI